MASHDSQPGPITLQLGDVQTTGRGRCGLGSEKSPGNMTGHKALDVPSQSVMILPAFSVRGKLWRYGFNEETKERKGESDWPACYLCPCWHFDFPWMIGRIRGMMMIRGLYSAVLIWLWLCHLRPWLMLDVFVCPATALGVFIPKDCCVPGVKVG